MKVLLLLILQQRLTDQGKWLFTMTIKVYRIVIIFGIELITIRISADNYNNSEI